MDQVEEWLNSTTTLLADIIGAQVKAGDPFTSEGSPEGHKAYPFTFTPAETVSRPQHFMSKDLGELVYEALDAESKHRGVNMQAVKMHFDPKAMEVRLQILVGSPPLFPGHQAPSETKGGAQGPGKGTGDTPP